MTDITQILEDLGTLESTEARLKELHDRVCGSGAFVPEGGECLNYEFVSSIIDQLYQDLGQHIFKNHKNALIALAKAESRRVGDSK